MFSTGNNGEVERVGLRLPRGLSSKAKPHCFICKREIPNDNNN